MSILVVAITEKKIVESTIYSHPPKEIFREINSFVLHTIMWKNEKFSLTEKILRQINCLVISLVKKVMFTKFLSK